MNRFRNLWMALEPRQRLILLVAVAAIGAAVFGLVQAVREPAMSTLYAGLDPAEAAEVAAAARAMGVEVQTEGGAVLVPSGERDRVRMALAANGMPSNGPAGYELLDGLDGFGTTSEMFEATYWRAKEGELARTILASPGVKSARVHVSNAVGRPFQRSARPTASITVTMQSGALSPDQAEAIRYLVASAVGGLEPQNVSVIDSAYGAVLRMGEAGSQGGQVPGGAREEKLRGEIERLLAARVGEGRAIVTVSVDTNMESETIVERLIDPETRIPISTDTREVEESATGGTGGDATVASNLPQQGGEGNQSQRQRTEVEERVNYEVSQTTRERVRRAGDVRRVTVAVLVDGVRTVGADGEEVWTPRSEDELTQLRDLVRSAVGYDEDRGDVVTVETLEFAARPEGGVVAEAGTLDFVGRNAPQLMQIGALAAVALGLAFFVLRPLMHAARDAPPLPERLPPALDFGVNEDMRVGEATDQLSLLRAAFAEQTEDSSSVLRGWLERDVQEKAEAEDHPAEGRA